jgi:hypothetical protein
MTIPFLVLVIAMTAGPNEQPAPQAFSALGDQTAAVLAPIKAMMAGIERRDAEMILAQVRPEGSATAVVEHNDGTTTVKRSDWATYLAVIKPGAERYQATLGQPAVQIDGNIAMVWVPYTFKVDGTLLHCGVDHFDLVRENAEWKVLNETWSQRTTGCSAK